MNPMLSPFALPLASMGSITMSFRMADTVGKTIIFILLIMSVVAWSIMVSKWLELKKVILLTRQFHDAYTQQEHPFSLLAARRRFSAAPLYAIYLAAGKEAAFIASQLPGSGLLPGAMPDPARFRFSPVKMDIIRRAVDRAASEQALTLEDKMPLLAISVSAAPFLGLLGTVWGVLVAFSNMATSFGGALLSAVAPGIAGALLTTVVGLLVALPSAIGYNLIVADIKRMCVQMDNFSDELMADLQSACSDRDA